MEDDGSPEVVFPVAPFGVDLLEQLEALFEHPAERGKLTESVDPNQHRGYHQHILVVSFANFLKLHLPQIFSLLLDCIFGSPK